MDGQRRSFTMIELVFVIVILGALAGVAMTWLLQTRTDSQVSMLKSDVSTLLKQIPAEVMAANMQVTDTPPSGYNTWSEWMLYVGALDVNRWQSNADGNGIWAVSYNSGNKADGSKIMCEGNYLYIDTTDGVLHFKPSEINTQSSNFCDIFSDSYSSKTEITIYLNQSHSTAFN